MAVTSFNHFPQISYALHESLKEIVKKTALDIQKRARQNAPVDTGLLKKSIYVTGAFGSTYAESIGQRPSKGTGIRKVSAKRIKAAAKKDQQLASLLNEVAADPSDPLTAYVAVAAPYGIYVEMGTRHMAAQPFFLPAVEEGRKDLEDNLSKIEGMLKGAVKLTGSIEVI